MDIPALDFLIFAVGGLIGLTLNIRRWKEITVFLQVALLVFKMARYFMNNHPHGKTIKKNTLYDEKFNKLYKDHLQKYDKALVHRNKNKRQIIIPEY